MSTESNCKLLQPCNKVGEVLRFRLFDSLSGNHSCLFLLAVALSITPDEWGSPGLTSAPAGERVVGSLEWGRRASPSSWTAKDRCRPRYERLIMVLTDKLLSETLEGALLLPQPLQSHSSSAHLSQAVTSRAKMSHMVFIHDAIHFSSAPPLCKSLKSYFNNQVILIGNYKHVSCTP
ncbi:unnamed protein product [Pleuronectes platessa]|uniref:Uncharacterized protein n=1 Tax=Pleuronectes platessa TaxID=8262 RepID=A0A9N7VDX8_PLEPL|nr:unnamed protein product [Pleuronectes platessa]